MKKLMTQKEIEAQIKKLQGRARSIASKRKAVLRDILGQMKKYEISLAEIRAVIEHKQKYGTKKKSGKKRTPVPIKYKGPNGETWTGRGRTPRWLIAAESAGRKREHFAI